MTNHYEEVIETSQYVGEEATVEFSSPLHRFFPKGKKNLNFMLGMISLYWLSLRIE